MNTSDYPAKESGRREPLNEAFTPDMITELGPNDVLVFGGAARTAFQRFGAVWGEGEGLQGQSYAIPTMHGGVAAIRPYVDRFIEFASQHPDLTFYVTRIGCGIAGFTARQIAPLFGAATALANVRLPRDFADILLNNRPA